LALPTFFLAWIVAVQDEQNAICLRRGSGDRIPKAAPNNLR
jgi:hypothetical protein